VRNLLEGNLLTAMPRERRKDVFLARGVMEGKRGPTLFSL